MVLELVFKKNEFLIFDLVLEFTFRIAAESRNREIKINVWSSKMLIEILKFLQNFCSSFLYAFGCSFL